MNRRIIVIAISFLFTVSAALTLVQCDHSGMARVTIHIQNDMYAQQDDSVIDKILKLVSTEAYALNAWTDHSSGEILLTISGPGMSTIETSLSPMESAFTTEVPAGVERTIQLIHDNGGLYAPEPRKPYGGKKTVTLDPGDNDVQIEMLPMTEISSVDPGSMLTVNWVSVSSVTINGYNVYRSLEPDGEYTFIGATGDNNLSDGDVETGKTYYYKVSVIGSNGEEGLKCEYDSGSPI